MRINRPILQRRITALRSVKVKGIMKKLLSLAVILLGVGVSQTNAKAGISFGISIGDPFRSGPRLPVFIPSPPVVVYRPSVPYCPPPVVVADSCDSHGHYYRGNVRYCEHGPVARDYRSHRDDRGSHGYRHDEGRYDRRRR